MIILLLTSQRSDIKTIWSNSKKGGIKKALNLPINMGADESESRSTVCSCAKLYPAFTIKIYL